MKYTKYAILIEDECDDFQLWKCNLKEYKALCWCMGVPNMQIMI